VRPGAVSAIIPVPSSCGTRLRVMFPKIDRALDRLFFLLAKGTLDRRIPRQHPEHKPQPAPSQTPTP